MRAASEGLAVYREEWKSSCIEKGTPLPLLKWDYEESIYREADLIYCENHGFNVDVGADDWRSTNIHLKERLYVSTDGKVTIERTRRPS